MNRSLGVPRGEVRDGGGGALVRRCRSGGGRNDEQRYNLRPGAPVRDVVTPRAGGLAPIGSRATIKAETSTAQHTHPRPHATYVQSGGTLQIRRPSGAPDTLRLVTGSAYGGKVETHITDNIGPTDVVLVTTDLKPPRARRTP